MHVAFRTAAFSVGTMPQPLSVPRQPLPLLALGHSNHFAVCYLSVSSLGSHLSLDSFTSGQAEDLGNE